MFSTNKHNKVKQLIKMIVGKYSVIGNVMGLVKCGRYSTLLSPDLRAVRRPQMKAINATVLGSYVSGYIANLVIVMVQLLCSLSNELCVI